ncbi:MAG: hypothetical protein A3K16_06850 [Omnitrophica bacterium RIFCSPLOWO2_01_FULL_45_24]|nr:MAG: hypothetical protein A3C51_02810 [Omnitrophica bacterium RIFCSPHIGHO2_02_FULL_46_20]OGW92955.1 MAG: hypothetical protein A3K16_06850 [Omnitrophica bacterium RIFCSPLOWO2_01_FULL_45_24]
MEDKAKRYARIKYGLALAEIAYVLSLLAILQASGFAFCLKKALTNLSSNQFFLIAAYSAAIFLIYILLNFFLAFYRSFVIERRFNLSNQRFFAWFLDYVKSGILGMLVFIILLEGFFFFIRAYPLSWWWMSALFWIFLSLCLARIFPILVIPLFFKYKKLKDEDLRRRILDLASKMRMKILDVFEIDFSKKSLKANAAFVGIGRSKRVLLTDTLLNGKFLPEEIELILAHEFAHYRFKHLIKITAINAVVILLTFYIFFRLGNLGLDIKDISNLGAWLFLFMLFQLVIMPFMNLISRIMETNADGEAIKVSGKIGYFISMMEKLAKQNLSEKSPPLWAKIFFYDHPPVDERINFARLRSRNFPQEAKENFAKRMEA